MPPKRSSKKAKTRLTARKRPASRSRCPRPRKKPALRLTDRMEAYSGSEDELNAFREHDKGVSLDDVSSLSQKDAGWRTAHLRQRSGSRAPQLSQPHHYPSPPRTPRPRTRAQSSDGWWLRASPEDSKDDLDLLAPSAPSGCPETNVKLWVDAVDQVHLEYADQDPLENIDEDAFEETRTFLATFGMHDYATMFHAKGLRTRADYVTFALDCLVKPNIVHDSLAEMFPTVPEHKCRPFSWVLCREVREELAQSARDVERTLCEAAGESSNAEEERGGADEERGDVDAEDGGSAMDSADEVAELLVSLVDEMQGEDEEG
ncbi:hypothetical protein EV121DRAFT_280699 [Schizophyllum commune]